MLGIDEPLSLLRTILIGCLKMRGICGDFILFVPDKNKQRTSNHIDLNPLLLLEQARPKDNTEAEVDQSSQQTPPSS